MSSTYLSVQFKLYLMETITSLSPLVYVRWEVELRSRCGPQQISSNNLILTLHPLEGSGWTYSSNKHLVTIVTRYLTLLLEHSQLLLQYSDTLNDKL